MSQVRLSSPKTAIQSFCFRQDGWSKCEGDRLRDSRIGPEGFKQNSHTISQLTIAGVNSSVTTLGWVDFQSCGLFVAGRWFVEKFLTAGFDSSAQAFSSEEVLLEEKFKKNLS